MKNIRVSNGHPYSDRVLELTLVSNASSLLIDPHIDILFLNDMFNRCNNYTYYRVLYEDGNLFIEFIHLNLREIQCSLPGPSKGCVYDLYG